MENMVTLKPPTFNDLLLWSCFGVALRCLLYPVGKTTLLERLKTNYTGFPGLEPEKVLPTVGLNVGRLKALNADFMFWDLGGQSGLRSIWDKYYSDSHAILFVVDSSDPQR